MIRIPQVYLDTNVIISRYKPKDPLFNIAERLFSEKTYTFVISPVTLFELYAVISRIRNHIVFHANVNEFVVEAIIRYIIENCKLKILSKSFLGILRINKDKHTIPIEYLIVQKIADDIPLRALDLLHIGYAYLLKQNIDYFVTGDEEILNLKKKIEEKLGIKVTHPTNLL